MGAVAQPSPAGGIADADFDYVFNEKELESILSFMSREDAGDLDISSVPLNGALPAVPGALQFQPHAPALLDGAGCIGVPAGHQAVAAAGTQGQGLGLCSMPAGAQAPLNEQLAGPEPSSAAAGGAAQQRHAGKVQRSAGSGGQMGPDGKPTVSHSMVEKQRRDRINHLIDELRELVPPQGCGPAGGAGFDAAQAAADSKRAKHVVLSDTIALVKELRDKVRLTPDHRSADGGAAPAHAAVDNGCAGTAAACDLIRRECPSSSPHHESSSSDSVMRDTQPCEMPSAPEGLTTWSGVIVEQGDGCLYVKVNCKDRRGLLGDVILTLKALPVEIKTAAVTTTGEGTVFDVFEVVLDEGSGFTPRDLQLRVHLALTEQHAGAKRLHADARG